MANEAHSAHQKIGVNFPGPIGVWFRMPLFSRIAIGLGVGLIAGICLHPLWHEAAAGAAAASQPLQQTPAWLKELAHVLSEFSRLALRVLGALAPALVLFAVMKALISTNIKGRMAGKLLYLMLLNTVIAICVGLCVANIFKPGAVHEAIQHATSLKISDADPLTEFLNSIPDSLLGPLVNNNSIGIVILALTFGIAIRKLPSHAKESCLYAISVVFDLVIMVLYWALQLVPFAVACKVAFITTTAGFSAFQTLGWFCATVLLALFIQSCYYMVRISIRSWVTPWNLLRNTRDALVMAFSTGSSVATMPLTYECMTKRIGLRADSASLGVLVGGNFNHDGTALYQAMSALFIAQLNGIHLSMFAQVKVVITAVVAAVGCAGIPEAGLVTMALIFTAVGLPVADVALLLPVDWFLDRCRTTINVLGDTSVACLLEGRKRTLPSDELLSEESAETTPKGVSSLPEMV